MTTYLEIAVNVPQVSGTFHYHLPPELEERVEIGCLVTIPFGRQMVQGVVLEIVDHPSVSKTKPVLDILDPEPVVTQSQIELARYLSEVSLTSLATCITLMLPPGLSQTADTLYQLTGSGKWAVKSGALEGQSEVSGPPAAIENPPSKIRDPKLTDAQKRFLALLTERGPLRGRQIDRALPRRNWKATAGALRRKGFVTSEAVLQAPKVRPKIVRTAQLACSAEEAEVRMDTLSRTGTPALARRQRIMRFLIQESGPVEVPWVYAESGGNISDLKRLEKMGLIFLGEGETVRDPLDKLSFVAVDPPELTRDQVQVWEQIVLGFQRARAGEMVRPFLLYGVTGSGKTEIYLRAVDHVMRQGKQAIVLVPEIALTPQTVQRFVARFPDNVGLVHSRLSPGERYDTWRRARAGLISLVVGPRSALFTPFKNIGLIIIDESHDQSYYQSESAPSYNARELAAVYARQIGALCLAGSATPDITTTFRAARGDWQAISLPDRILAHKEAVRMQLARVDISSESERVRYRPLEADAQTTELPPVNIIDMRDELQNGNRSIFSRALQAEIARTLEYGQQGILFLNRRGMATYVFCRDCGYTLKCPRCDIPLTFHVRSSKRSNALICHRCGYTRNMPAKCPECGSARIKQFGTGTERVEAEVHELFPDARTLRWDWETTRQKGSHDAILSQFAGHQADILIGTQMLAKGLDLPLVTLVGAVLADVGLQLPDYRATERAFQVLTQVAGRAGRSPLGGQVILQTFQPDHYVIQMASQHDYRGFYRQELEYRRQLGYPPFARLARLEFRGQDEYQVEETAQNLARQIQAWINQSRQVTEIIGPVPCFFARQSGNYRWQIVLRGPDPLAVLRSKDLKEARLEVDPPSLL
jgi:primosomal protein N' (replication factor Y)